MVVFATTPAADRYAALHALHIETSMPGAALVARQLWRVPARHTPSCSLSVTSLLQPVARARAFHDLLDVLRAQPTDAATRWSLSYQFHPRSSGSEAAAPVLSSHAEPSSASGDERGDERGEADTAVTAAAISALRGADFLCAIAHVLDGRPALGAQGAQALVLLRTPRLWYLCESLPIARLGTRRREAHEAAATLWAQRPYSFSAATDPSLAMLALSLALRQSECRQREMQREASEELSGELGEGFGGDFGGDFGDFGSSRRPMVIDPCCGSGTMLFGAAQLGMRSVGFDLNPRAVAGTRDNLIHVGLSEESSRVFEHDCTLPLPANLSLGSSDQPPLAPPLAPPLVVTVLPFGRQQRIPHALYLTKLLKTLAELEGSTFCFVSAEHPSSYFELARAAGEPCERLEMIASVPVGSMLAKPRCYVNLANAVSTSSASPDCSGDPIQAAHAITHGAAHRANRTRCLLLPTPFSAYVTPHSSYISPTFLLP